MKPSYTFTEMCTLISLIDCKTDATTILSVLISEYKRYPENEYNTLSMLLRIRSEKYNTAL
jgi:hypothetical protein